MPKSLEPHRLLSRAGRRSASSRRTTERPLRRWGHACSYWGEAAGRDVRPPLGRGADDAPALATRSSRASTCYVPRARTARICIAAVAGAPRAAAVHPARAAAAAACRRGGRGAAGLRRARTSSASELPSLPTARCAQTHAQCARRGPRPTARAESASSSWATSVRRSARTASRPLATTVVDSTGQGRAPPCASRVPRSPASRRERLDGDARPAPGRQRPSISALLRHG